MNNNRFCMVCGTQETDPLVKVDFTKQCPTCDYWYCNDCWENQFTAGLTNCLNCNTAIPYIVEYAPEKDADAVPIYAEETDAIVEEAQEHPLYGSASVGPNDEAEAINVVADQAIGIVENVTDTHAQIRTWTQEGRVIAPRPSPGETVPPPQHWQQDRAPKWTNPIPHDADFVINADGSVNRRGEPDTPELGRFQHAMEDLGKKQSEEAESRKKRASRMRHIITMECAQRAHTVQSLQEKLNDEGIDIAVGTTWRILKKLIEHGDISKKFDSNTGQVYYGPPSEML